MRRIVPMFPHCTAARANSSAEILPAASGRVAEGCGDANQKPNSHDTSRIVWAKLLARVGEEFPLECPNCGGEVPADRIHHGAAVFVQRELKSHGQFVREHREFHAA